MNPVEILERHRLPTGGLDALPGGTVNLTWRTDTHVIRIGERADHAREASRALAARRVGIRTPRPIVWAATYSIWDRVAGQTAESAGAVRDSAWNALLDDLELLHANPLEPRRATDPTVWTGRTHLVESTQARAAWTRSELDAFHRILGSRRPLRNPAFVHGDAFGRNVLVDEHAEYLALIDWGCAGWSSLEAECARLEREALELALRRWRARLDVPLLLRIRLDFFLEVAALSRMSFEEVRRLLDRVIE